MFHLTVRDHVMVAHSLADPFFGPAQALHGATYVVEATWRRRRLTPQAVVIDIGTATGLLRDVLADLDYRNLDEHPAFAGRLTTTEALAEHIARRLLDGFDPAPYAALDVVLREHPDAWAGYTLALPDAGPP